MPARSLRHPSDLAQAGLIQPDRADALTEVAARYAVSITPAVADLIDPANDRDPIARQYVPSAGELDTQAEEFEDPIGDGTHTPVEGIVHRYPDRVLLTPVHVCAVYCRFCFRREVVGPGRARSLPPAALARALDYIRGRPEIWEVILTGGDPLVMSPRRLRSLGAALADIRHVRVLRLHTRIPVVDPGRVDGALVRALKESGKAVWVGVHVNHPRELTAAARAALARLADGGFPLVGQSVLLAGVNDDPETLEALFRGLVECRVKPYYLHHPDLAPGTSGFRTTIAHGQELMRDLHGRVSGLCRPTYALDIPGGHGKAPIGPSFLADAEADEVSVEDWRGGRHPYPPRRDP